MQETVTSKMSQLEYTGALCMVRNLHNACKLYGDSRHSKEGTYSHWELTGDVYSYSIDAATVRMPECISFITVVIDLTTNEKVVTCFRRYMNGKCECPDTVEDFRLVVNVHKYLKRHRALTYWKIENEVAV